LKISRSFSISVNSELVAKLSSPIVVDIDSMDIKDDEDADKEETKS
jgi:hypothetical protein